MASDPVQRKIIDALADSPKTIGELSAATGIHRVTVSKHAGILEGEGLLKRQNIGKAKVYSLNKRQPAKKAKAKAKKRRKPKVDLDSLVRRLVAKELAQRKIVSLDEAAEIACVSKSEFCALLGRKGGA